MKKKCLSNHPLVSHRHFYLERLHALSYRMAIHTLNALRKKMQISSRPNRSIYSLEPLDKDEKKILLELIKMQVLPDRKMESEILKAIEDSYDT